MLTRNIASLSTIHLFAHNWVVECVKINRPTDTSTLQLSKMQGLLRKSASQVGFSKDLSALF